MSKSVLDTYLQSFNLNPDEETSTDDISSDLQLTSNHATMTQDEIIHCIDIIRNGTQEEQSEATEEILIRNKPLIKFIIKSRYPTYMAKYFEDMMSHGYIGIMTALFRADPPYDPRVSKFSTFVTPYILHELSDCISAMVYNTSPHYASMSKKINRAISSLQRQGITDPNLTDIMIETKMGDDAINAVLLMQSANSAIPLNHDNVSELADDYGSPLEIAEHNELIETLVSAMQKLDRRQRRILELSLGLNNQNRRKQADISKMLGITVQEVHRLRSNAYRALGKDRKLRSFFQNESALANNVNILLEETEVPIVLSRETLQREINALSLMPMEL